MSSRKPRKPGSAADLRAQAAERAALIVALGWAPEAPGAAERYCATTSELAQLVRAAREERARAVGIQVVTLDGDILEKNTAAKMAQLCALRGVQAEIVWDGAQYLANGEACGRSIHGVYAWLDRQPGVKQQ